jgi:hypothetical protein
MKLLIRFRSGCTTCFFKIMMGTHTLAQKYTHSYTPTQDCSTSATEVNIAKAKEIVTENPYSTMGVLATELSVSHESICTILTNQLGMKHVATRLVPKDLNFLQKLNRIRVAEYMQ